MPIKMKKRKKCVKCNHINSYTIGHLVKGMIVFQKCRKCKELIEVLV
jgi:transcription elongation factor Elf1